MRNLILLSIFLTMVTQDTDRGSSEVHTIDYRVKNSGKIFQNYLIPQDGNNSNLLYVELSFNESAEKGSPFSYFKIDAFWYTDIVDVNGIFMGIGQTRLGANSTFTDLKICRTFLPLRRCDDFSVDYKNLKSTADNIVKNFSPLKDASQGGSDDLLDSTANQVILKYIEPFSSLFRATVTVPSYSNDHRDLDLDFRNNLTIVIGELAINGKEELIDRFSDYVVRRAFTKNLTILLGENYLSINYLVTACAMLLLLTFD